jgi:S1-C subfamily serine protease
MFCPGCGTGIPDDSSFCLKCGRSMSVAPNAAKVTPAVETSTQPRKLPSPAVWIISGLAIVALAGIVYKVNQGKAVGAVTASSLPTATKIQEPPPVKLSPGDISAKYADAVVVLDSYNDQGVRASQGSGFVSSPDGTVLTNYHVIRGASRMTARMHDQSIHEVEYVGGFDIQHDVAVIKIEGANLPSIHVGTSAGIKTGDHVVALGAPLGLESTLSDGIISAIRESGTFRLFQTSAPISRGSSGGPIFDDYGNVIALAVATIETGENLNFAVPIDSAKTLLTQSRQTSFPELLAMTTMHQPIITSSISIPPQVMTYNITVPPQGGILSGSLLIAGGMGNDLGISVASDAGVLVWNGGVVQRNAVLNLRLRGGRYSLVLNNHVGAFWISSKTVSGMLELTYYR